MTQIDGHLIPLKMIKYEPKLTYSGENLKQWFSVYIKVPELDSASLSTLMERLDTASLIILSPILLD